MNLNTWMFVNKVRASVEWADDNPNMDDMPDGSSHWRVTLHAGRHQMTVPFSQGPAISSEPTAADVLDCLASDAAGYDDAGSFDEWASEYGYDTDSRKAERTYRAVERQVKQLRRLLTDEAYQSLLYDTERL